MFISRLAQECKEEFETCVDDVFSLMKMQEDRPYGRQLKAHSSKALAHECLKPPNKP